MSLFLNFNTHWFSSIKNAGYLSNLEIDGVSSDNDFIPLYALFMNKGVYNKKIVHYSIPFDSRFPIGTEPHTSSYRALYNNLKLSRTNAFHTAALRRNGIKIIIGQGILFTVEDDGSIDILLLFAVNADKLPEVAAKTVASPKEYFKVFVSTRLSTSTELKSLYKKLFDEVIKAEISEGIDMIITDDIAKRCFNNNMEITRFKTITELREHYKEYNKFI